MVWNLQDIYMVWNSYTFIYTQIDNILVLYMLFIEPTLRFLFYFMNFPIHSTVTVPENAGLSLEWL